MDKVRADWFIVDAVPVEVELTDELKAAMVTNAEMYLRAVGTLTWEKWSLLSEASRAAFLEAGERVRTAV
jgi:hypothetical protein